MGTIKRINKISAYSLKPNSIQDIRTMNGAYAPSVFDTTDIELYLDPADENTYQGTGTTFRSSLGTTQNGTFQGGMESGYDSTGWFDTDGVNDFAYLPSYSLGTQWTIISWGYAERGTNVNVYGVNYTSALTNGVRFDIGNNPAGQWTRYVFIHNGGNTVVFTNSQPQGYWYMQYAIMNSGVSTLYGCSEPAGTFAHNSTTALTVTAGTAPANSTLNTWGNGAVFSNYEVGKVGQFWVFSRVLTTTEIEQIYNNTKSRYGY